MQTSVTAKSSMVQVRAAVNRAAGKETPRGRWAGSPGVPQGHRRATLTPAPASLTNTVRRQRPASPVLFLLREKLFSRSEKAKNKLGIKVPKEKALVSQWYLKNNHHQQMLAFMERSVSSFPPPSSSPSASPSGTGAYSSLGVLW